MNYQIVQNLLNLLNTNELVRTVRPSLSEKLIQLDTNQTVLIAITGETASGKSVLMNTIQNYLPNATYLSTDNYFKDFSEGIALHGSFDALLAAGYAMQAPYSIHMDILRQNLIDLKAGKDVLIPQHLLDGSGKTILNTQPVKASNLIFVDGFCTLYDQTKDLFDFAIYLQADTYIQKQVFFDLSKERGATEEQAKRIFKILSVSSDIYIKPTEQYADLILNIFENENQKDKLVQSVVSLLSGKQAQEKSLTEKLINPTGDLALLWNNLTSKLQKQILKELKDK